MKCIWYTIVFFIALSSSSCEDDDDSGDPINLYGSSFYLVIAGSEFEHSSQDNSNNLCETYSGLNYIYSKRWINDRVIYRARIGTPYANSSPGIIGFELYVTWDSSQEIDVSLFESLREIEAGNSTRTARLRMFAKDANGNGFATFLMANELDVTLEDINSVDSLNINLIEDPNCGLWGGRIMSLDYTYEGQAYSADGSDSIYIDNAKVLLFAPAKN